MKDTLPDKPSELIRVALADLRKVERSKKYVVYMGVYHEPDRGRGGKCFVCLAGAVMAKSLSAARDRPLFPEDFPKPVKHKLIAIDSLRIGHIRESMDYLGKRLPKTIPHYIDVEDYGDDPAQFNRDMRKLAKLLEDHGL